ncbi:ATP-binding protein [Methylocaldum sp.]|uniref:ATP-binding protein n=1 Tax=Methylocaldum sp. TaxID=1969727 RepID=UPI002D55CBC3|nr:helicase HerA-like domain-containing protein [Methylocaldum sp.]HYE34528.1 helicase HerA-like domain-containing protein [Methylocaldum sp.]
MSEETDTLIGHLLEVRSGQFVAKLLAEEEGFRPMVSVGGELEVVGQVGSYVSIRQHGCRSLALINHVEADRSDARTSRSAAGCLVTLTPLGQIAEKGSFQRGVRQFPTPGAELHVVAQDEINSVFAKDQRYRLNLGYLRSYPATGVCLDPSALCSRHFAILGQSGSGKSWSVASLIQRMVDAMPNAHIILLDLHGEYCWKDRNRVLHSAFKPEQTRYLDARALEIPYWLMTFAELIDLLIDRNDQGAAVQTAFLRETIYGLKKKSAKSLDLEMISLDSPIYFSLQEVYDSFKEANEFRTDFGKSKGPLFGQFDEFLVKLQSRLHDVRYDFLLNPVRRNRSESLPGLLRDFVGLGDPKCQITIIDLSPVPFDVRPTVSAQIGRLAFEFNYWNPFNREFPILLICEEAHAYIPREASTQFEGTRKTMERIAKEGRKYGVGLGVVSQRPHELSETVLSQCGTYICLRITNPDDQDYVRKLVPEGESNLVDVLTSLSRGEAMILGEAILLPTRTQVFKPDPTPNSNDADFYTAWISGPEDLDMDGIVDRWRRQGR